MDIINNSEDEVVLEGGAQDGAAVRLGTMRKVAFDSYEFDDPGGVYRHLGEDGAYWRNGQRRAVFEAAVPEVDV